MVIYRKKYKTIIFKNKNICSFISQNAVLISYRNILKIRQKTLQFNKQPGLLDILLPIGLL